MTSDVHSRSSTAATPPLVRHGARTKAGAAPGRAKARRGLPPEPPAQRADTPAPAPQVLPHTGQAVFPIDEDETLGRLVAMFLHGRLFGTTPARGQPRNDGLLRRLGWPEDLVQEMSAMPIEDIARMLSGPDSCLGLVFDARKAAGVIHSYRALRNEEQDLEFFIVHGATPTLIRALFPNVGARAVGQMRKRLGCGSRGGRPRMPEAQVTYDIYRCWQALCAQQLPLRARYIELKKQFPSLSLATLHTAIETC